MGYENAPTNDPYCYPGSVILINLPGFRDESTLQNFETEVSQLRHISLELTPILGSFDLSHLQAIHYFLFQDVYAWAGKVRVTNIAKDQTYFCKPEFIESYAEQVFSELTAERAIWFPEGAFSPWVEGLAKCYADINALHPFRDGNGRTQRIFFNQLVKEHNHYFDWARASQEEMLHASIESFSGRLQPLRMLLGKCLFPNPEAIKQE